MSDATCYLVFCRKNGRVVTLGPVKQTYEEADDEITNLRADGWDAAWVGLNDEAVFIIPTKATAGV